MHPGDVVTERKDTVLSIIRQALAELGWVDGKTLLLEPRYAPDDAERLRVLASELVHIPVDILLTVATAATHAAQNATTTIPIVMFRWAILSQLDSLPVSRGPKETSPALPPRPRCLTTSALTQGTP